jgi:uncharacterized protein (TIGR00159 family)
VLRLLDDLRENLRIGDLLDMLVVAFVVYFALSNLRRETTRPLVVAGAIVLLLHVLARRLEMVLTSLLFQAGLAALLVALVVLFQEEIRRGFERLASWMAPRSRRATAAQPGSVGALVEAVARMAQDRVGALVVLPGREPLDNHMRGGVPLDAIVSFPLVYSLFETSSPGHDGAMVLRGQRVERFGVQLPLSRNVERVLPGGTRHSAALGLAEVSDALVLVVSEERGTISVAQEGRLQVVEATELPARLHEFFGRTTSPQPGGRRARWSRNLGAKVASVALAVVLWFAFAYRVERIERSFTVPIELRDVAAEWVVRDIDPASVVVTLSGPERVFELFDPSEMILSVAVDPPRAGRRWVALEAADLRRPKELSVTDLEPEAVEIVLEPASRALPPADGIR